MNKQQVAERLSDECGFSKAQGARVVDAFLESITECLESGDEISFPGFGKFLTSEQKARESVNPRDRSQKIHIDAKTVPKFRAGTALKTAVAEIAPPASAKPRERTSPATDGTAGAQPAEAPSPAADASTPVGEAAPAAAEASSPGPEASSPGTAATSPTAETSSPATEASSATPAEWKPLARRS